MAARKQVLWLHPQPEHYFNCMLDELAGSEEIAYTAAFCWRGPGQYQERPLPVKAGALVLRPQDANASRGPGMFGRFHADWKADLAGVTPDAVIVSGYGGRTQREAMGYFWGRGVPVAMFSDSNLRSERGRGCKAKLKRRVKRAVLAGVMAHVDRVLTANRLGVAYWRYYGVGRRKITVCPYYADYAGVAAAGQTRREEVLGRHGLEPGRRLIVTGARLVPAKGLDLAIRAFRAARLGEAGWTYAIAGTGELEKALKALAGEELGKSIRFLGFLQPTEWLALLRHAELFLLPSVYEPHGIVVQEAMACGTPVVASDVCGAAYDLVEAGRSGELFKSGDAGALAKVLGKVTGQREGLAAMRAGARQCFEEWHAANNPVQVVDRVVREMLKMPVGIGGRVAVT